MKFKQIRNADKASLAANSRGIYKLKVNEPTSTSLLRSLIVWVQLPGIEQKSLDVCLEGNVLTIKEAEKVPLDVSTLRRPDIVGESCELRACLNRVAQAAGRDDCVLVCGDTGTGKELFARAIHQNSRRAAEKFVVVDCRSMPEPSAEKLLLGQRQSSRTELDGLLTEAAYGTLFLDEVGDLPISTQQLFQTLLQEQKYRPVDSNEEFAITFRLIAATNRNLELMAAQGKFNPDLLALLQPLQIEIPPLRERLEDIDPLTDYFLQRYCQAQNLITKDRSPEFMEMLKKYPWPGNVRELENSLEQALLAAKSKKTLFPKDLPAHIRVQVAKSTFGKKKAQSDEQKDSFFGGFFMAENPL